MDVDLGVGLGDDLGGFEGFDELLSNPNQSDFFKFCALEEGGPQHDSKATLDVATPASGSTVVGTNQGRLEEYSTDCDDWDGVQARDIAKSKVTHGYGAAMYAAGKPRARKRQEEDDAIFEATEAPYPILKRRASADSSATIKVQDLPCPTVRHSRVTRGDQLVRSPSFDGRMPDDVGRKFEPGASFSWEVLGAGLSRVRSTSRFPAPGGAIKVKRDVMSVNTRPRISVFMSSSAARGGAKKQPSSPGTPLDLSHRASKLSPLVTSPMNGSSQASLRVPNVTSQRIRGLRVVVPRSRSQAEQRVVDSNPPVVAMGSRRNGLASPLASPLNGIRVMPRLHRASSVGALTIAGSGDVVSRSQVLSPSGSLLQSCELSEQFAGRSQRRNLVCKVFSSGNRSSRPSPGPY